MNILRMAVAMLVLLGARQAWSVEKNVTFVVYQDLSASTQNDQSKITEIVPLITSSLKKSCGNFRVALSNLFYYDQPAASNHLELIGYPRFVTDEMGEEAADEAITTRITNPFLAAYEAQQRRVATGYSEVTYSSVPLSLQKNPEIYRDQDVVVALIITDALPVIEFGTADTETAKIKKMLGATEFVAGAITAPTLGTDSKGCYADFPPPIDGAPVVEQDFVERHSNPIYSQWLMNNPMQLEKFVKQNGGWQWNICDPGYEQSLKDFMAMVVEAAGCELNM